MPRPARPLLSEDTIVATALAIIDSDGVEAVSLNRLARALNVQAPSLYHHFPDKAAILEAVARAIVLETPRPRRVDPEDWTEFFVTQSLNFRRTVLRHANAAPILLEHLPHDVFTLVYDDYARLLTDVGVPPGLQVLVLEGLDRLTLGAALTEAMKRPAMRARIFPPVDPETEPSLARAVLANRFDAEALWAESIRTFLDGVRVRLPRPEA